MKKLTKPSLEPRPRESRAGVKKPTPKVFRRFKNLLGSAVLAGALALTGCSFDIHGLNVGPKDAATDVQTPQKDANDGKDVITIADAGVDAQQDALQDSTPDAKPWWNTGWQYCRQIDITGSFPADYSHGMVLNTTNFDYSHAKSDLTDLRFIQGKCETPDVTTGTLSAWAETVNTTGDSKVWVKTKTENAPSVAMYYNNNAAPSVFSISDTFLFGDDFSGSGLDAGKWNCTGTCTQSSGLVTLEQSTITSMTMFPIDTILAARAKFSGSSAGSVWDAYLGFYPDDNDFAIWGYDGPSTRYPSQRLSGAITMGNNGVTDNTYHLWDIRRNSNVSAMYYYDGALDQSITSDLPVNPAPIMLRGNSPGSRIDVNYVYVRKYLASEPTYLIGTEESQQ